MQDRPGVQHQVPKWLRRQAARGRLWRRTKARWLADAEYEAARRKLYHPPRLRNGSVIWAAIDDYYLLAEAARFDVPWTPAEFMAGPMGRFIDLCADESVNIRVRARTMEFARGAVGGFKRRRVRSEAGRLGVDRMVMVELESRLDRQGPNGRYLIDVYLGKRDHNS